IQASQILQPNTRGVIEDTQGFYYYREQAVPVGLHISTVIWESNQDICANWFIIDSS
ncbi:hypothetical protein GIB67_027153, partial [Kingdonia uniflora]